VFRNIEMKYLASTMLNDEETIQNPESESRYGEEIHGCDDFAMIAQERSPELAFLVGGSQAMEIARNGAFGDLKSKL
jgi:hypothetical protein